MRYTMFCLTLLVSSLACRKQECLKKFEFHFPATITQGDTFNIGDTLWMEMDLPNQLIDHQTGELVDLSNFDLYFSFGLNKLDTNYANNVVNDFNLIERVGSINQEMQGRFLITNVHFKSITEKKLSIGMIPKKKGVYMMSLDLPMQYILAEEYTDPAYKIEIINSPCRQLIAEYSGTRFERGCPNYYLMRQYPCVQSSFDNTNICLDDSTFMAHRGGHAFVVQ